ncbi:MAG: RidA family protein [Candidatus Accumulibacter sp.]|jgi:enamine deaminase RidA (YjgF/YER057c/UK114 family)|nr:RidA family protein [Accumulibacter sp.]
MNIERHGTTRRYSDVVARGDTVYLAEVPESLDADIAGQTLDMLARVERRLTQAGSDRSRLLLATIYLRDMADYDGMNAVWDAWVPAGAAPARACVEARLSHPGMRVEIVLIAARCP